MLAAYNLGDYQAFSRDLSLPAKLIVDEEAFAEFRTENLSVTEGLSARLPVEQVEVGTAPEIIGDEVELLVVGGPTHAFG